MTKWCHIFLLFFFFNDTATTEIYTLSLHDALPISRHAAMPRQLSNTTNRSMFAANALRRRRRLLAKLEQLGSDLLHGRCSERDTASETPQVSRVPDLSSAHEVGKTDAGKVVYFEMSHLERVAAP